MSLDASTAQVLSALVKSVSAGLVGNWVATPVPERLAILAREEIIRFVRETFPAAAIEKEDAPGLRRVAVRVYTPRDCHRVETWGVPCEPPPRDCVPDALSGYSWILLAHQCGDEGDCPRLAQWEARLRAHELKRLEYCVRERLTLSLWMGTHAPDGCPSCQPAPKDAL